VLAFIAVTVRTLLLADANARASCLQDRTEAETMKNALGPLLSLSIALAGPVHAQSSAPPPPPLTTRHYDEDYLYLRDPAARTGAWWEPLKYVPLNATGDVYLTLGAELRLRYEHFENNNWGQGPATNDGYLWYRALPLADLHLGPNVRLFGQLIAGWAADKEDKSPVDETGVDLLQGFADLKLPLGDDNASLTLRPGRQMLTYGSERLIGLRYGPNILRTFDGAKSFLEVGDWRVDGFYARPVAPRLGNFDDRTDDTQSVWSLYATRRNLPVGQGTGLDVYYIGFDNDAAVFNQGAGAERRQTLGARLFGQAQGWDWNWEVFYQFGTFGDGAIRA
jgi:Alginate export